MRAGGEKRGNNRDRKRRREWLLKTFDQDLGPDLARCHLKISNVCAVTVNAGSLTVDRINPGGTYARDNIRPACIPCQTKQGALISYWKRYQWKEWMDEAEALGIDWDGQLT